VLDLGLPGIAGEEVCRQGRTSSDLPTIMLTAWDAEEDIVKGFESGADDYLTKPFSPRELTARVGALLRQMRSDAEPQADVLEPGGGRLVLDSASRCDTLDSFGIELTESEFRLLRTLARFPGPVYTRMELIDKVQGYEYEGYERTIDAHVKNSRRKLGEEARSPRLIEAVHGCGYTFAEVER
jgi:two-component system, OmpR family, response regulator RegX3